MCDEWKASHSKIHKKPVGHFISYLIVDWFVCQSVAEEGPPDQNFPLVSCVSCYEKLISSLYIIHIYYSKCLLQSPRGQGPFHGSWGRQDRSCSSLIRDTHMAASCGHWELDWWQLGWVNSRSRNQRSRSSPLALYGGRERERERDYVKSITGYECRDISQSPACDERKRFFFCMTW